MRVLYRITDAITKEVLEKNANSAEVEKEFGFRPRFPKEKNKYRYGRYIVERRGDTKQYISTELWRQWEDMNIAAELLRTGQGKIVSKIENGKRIKFVEPKGARK